MRYEVRLSAIKETHVTRTIYVDADNEQEAREQAVLEAEQTQDWEDAHYEDEYRDVVADECIDENSPEFEGDEDDWERLHKFER